MMSDEERLKRAVAHFWSLRDSQNEKQGLATGVRDAGHRAAVTGGAQLDGFVELLRDIALECGLSDAQVHIKDTVLPGYYRPTKKRDIVVVNKGMLVAVVEFKSHIGPSFGNNFNNRVEEALGSSADFIAAYRNGAFKPSPKPWLGWLMLLEDAPGSHSPVKVRGPHYPIFSEFNATSYCQRYALFCTKLLRERMYDGACLLLSRRKCHSIRQLDSAEEISFSKFITSYRAQVLAHGHPYSP